MKRTIVLLALWFSLAAIAEQPYTLGGHVLIGNESHTVVCGLYYLNGEPVKGSDQVFGDARSKEAPGEYRAHCVFATDHESIDQLRNSYRKPKQ